MTLSDIMQEFIEDAREHLQAAGQHLIRIEKAPDGGEDINGLLRRVHSIKGNAGFLDLRSIYELLHKTENILQAVREDHCAHCTPGLIDVLFKVLDLLEVMIGQLEDGGNDQAAGLDALMAELDHIDRNLAALGPAPERQDGGLISGEADAVPDKDLLDDWGVAEAPADDISSEPHGGRTGGGGPESISDLCRTVLEVDDPKDIPAAANRMLDAAGGRDGWRFGPNTRLALELVRNYALAMPHDPGEVPAESAAMLEGLVRNLANWIDAEGPSLPVENAVSIQVTRKGLAAGPDQLAERARSLISETAGSDRRIVFDLRGLSALTSAETGVLVRILKDVPGRDNTGLLLDRENQKGLLKVLQVMGLDRAYRICNDESGTLTGPERSQSQLE